MVPFTHKLTLTGGAPTATPGVWPRRLADCLLLLAYSAQVVIFWSMDREDVFICYRYARNLVRGDGFVYNPGEYVEGISNPLWTLLLALFKWLGVPIVAADNFMVLFFAVAAFLVFRRTFIRLFGDAWVARLPLALLVCMTAMTAGYGYGLEGSAVTCAGAVMLAGAVATVPRTLALGAVMLLTLRPEGFAYTAWAFMWLLVITWREPKARKNTMSWALFAVGFFVSLTAFRLCYYGDFVPNTVRAKGAALDHQIIEAGTRHVMNYLWMIGPILVLLAAAGVLFRKWRGVWLFAAVFAGLNMAAVWRNGGDWMMYYRLLSPNYGLLAFLAVIPVAAARDLGRWRAVLVGVVCLAGGIWNVQPGVILRYARDLPSACSNMWGEPVDYDHLFDSHVSLADFREKDDRMVVEFGGETGYAMDGVPVMDMWGLTDTEVARGTGPGSHFIAGEDGFAGLQLSQRPPRICRCGSSRFHRASPAWRNSWEYAKKWRGFWWFRIGLLPRFGTRSMCSLPVMTVASCPNACCITGPSHRP